MLSFQTGTLVLPRSLQAPRRARLSPTQTPQAYPPVCTILGCPKYVATAYNWDCCNLQFGGKTASMAPAFFKSLRRRSRASFRTDRSTDDSSEGAFSNGTGQSSGLATPASTAYQSDPALHLQVTKESTSPSKNELSPQSRPPLAPITNLQRQSSAPGMSGLGAPSMNGKSNLPISPYAPRLLNVSENAWVSYVPSFRRGSKQHRRRNHQIPKIAFVLAGSSRALRT